MPQNLKFCVSISFTYELEIKLVTFKHNLVLFERAFSGLLDVIFVPDIRNWRFVGKISNNILPTLKLVTKQYIDDKNSSIFNFSHFKLYAPIFEIPFTYKFEIKL